MNIQIKSWLNGSVLFELDCEENSIKVTVEAAVKAGVSLNYANLVNARLALTRLAGANLVGARLDGANLDGANLYRANLAGANLVGARLDGANLDGANLYRANLAGANLAGANLAGASLVNASLAGANLVGARLAGANLVGANLNRANLDGANLDGANLPNFSLVPDEGVFTAWKKLKFGVIAKLEIPEDAKRTSSLVGRKNRCSKAKVVALFNCESGIGFSMRDSVTKYEVGGIVEPNRFDDDIRVECTCGIHFFITRKEAEEYQ